MLMAQNDLKVESKKKQQFLKRLPTTNKVGSNFGYHSKKDPVGGNFMISSQPPLSGRKFYDFISTTIKWETIL